MNTRKGRLGFELPVVVENMETKLDVTPSGIRQWCAELPMTQTGHVAKEVYFALMEILQCKLKVQDLFAILELLQPSVQWVCQSLKKYYVDQTKPLDDNQLVIVNLGQTLQANLMLGYKQVIEELAADGIAKNKNKDMVVAAIFRTLYHARIILVCNYQLYTIATPNFWRELYIVYNFANENNLMEALPAEGDGQSIAAWFKMIFILAAANPYQWRQLEQELINSATYAWEAFTTMRPAKKSDFTEPGIFIIDLLTDSPPEPAMLNKVTFSTSCIAIDVSELAKHLEQVLEKIRVQEGRVKHQQLQHERDPESNIPLNSLKILCAQWAKPIVRKEARVKAEGEIEAVFGYAAVHYFVNGKKMFDLKKLDKIFEHKSIKAVSVDEVKSAELNNVPNDDYAGYMCKVLDSSKKGSLILWHGIPDAEMVPGRIVGFKHKEGLGHTPWMLGVIAWIKRVNKKDLMLGLEHLDAFAEAAAVQLEKNGEGVGNFQLGFVLPKVEKLGNNPTIITPIVPFKEHATVRVVLNDTNTNESMTVMLQKEVYETRNFRQFEFKIKEINELAMSDADVKKFEPYAKGEAKAKKRGLFADKHGSKFDSVWDKLD